MLKRTLAIMALMLGDTATSCLASAAIAVMPASTVSTDSAAPTAFALAARVAARRGLTPFRAPDQDEEAWNACFTRETFFLCGKMYGREIQFEMYQARTPRFTPWADSVRVELLDSLRTRFGAPGVRECEWRISHAPPGSGCAPP